MVGLCYGVMNLTNQTGAGMIHPSDEVREALLLAQVVDHNISVREPALVIHIQREDFRFEFSATPELATTTLEVVHNLLCPLERFSSRQVVETRYQYVQVSRRVFSLTGGVPVDHTAFNEVADAKGLAMLVRNGVWAWETR